jgi:16S rRNA G966 N2-methylase RsmD
MTDLATNVLSYGDNLDILRRHLPDAAVDLAYLDPPFNSNRGDDVTFRDEPGNAADAQLLAKAMGANTHATANRGIGE